MATFAVNQLQIAPLGAGDLIDRTVRLYRRHFMALIRASAPPVVISSVGSILFSVVSRAIGMTESEGRLIIYVPLAFLGLFILFLGFIAQLIVMGGASRNLVMHLLWDEPVTARLIYRSVRSRFWGLLGATLMVVLFLVIAMTLASVVLFAAIMLMILVAILTAVVGVAWVTAVASLLTWVVGLVLWLYVFFLIAGRVAYVPQAMMVEGLSVTAAFGRSGSLARGNVRRLMAMFLFTTFAGYSAVMLLLVPLGWFGYLNGISPFEMDATRLPAWYAVSQQVIAQLSTILLAPVWMLGLSLLYVDERVRYEGYDIELMAAQRFGEMPALPAGVSTPLAPAIAAPQQPAPPAPPPRERDGGAPPGSILGLTGK